MTLPILAAISIALADLALDEEDHAIRPECVGCGAPLDTQDHDLCDTCHEYSFACAVTTPDYDDDELMTERWTS